MPSTPRAFRRGISRNPGSAANIRLAALAALLAVGLLGLTATEASANPGNGNACPPSSHNPGGDQPCGIPPDSEPPPETPPPPPQQDPPPTPTSSGSGGVAGAKASGGSTRRSKPSRSSEAVTPTPAPAPHAPAHHRVKRTKPAKAVPAPAPPALSLPVAAPKPESERSTFADSIPAPGDIDLSAENLGEGSLLALLLAALLYLPVTIFNKATEKNHEAIRRWFERPRAWLAAAFGWIPVSRHPLLTLTGGVLASAVLFAFIEPGFPTEPGALQYLTGMVMGFALVSVVFFASWRLVLHRLEPDGTGHWRIYPPYIVLAAFLVVMARLAHFIPGVVLGTVAEYEPSKRLSTRTAGIRVAVTYGALMVLGLAAWFAWIPVEHAASQEHPSSLTLILDSALAITFVSSLESIAFGLIPMTFLDGNDLFRWHRGLWAAIWGASLVWFSVVIMHPALSTYGHEISSGRIIWFALLFSMLMLVAVGTWAFFRLRDARAARATT